MLQSQTTSGFITAIQTRAAKRPSKDHHEIPLEEILLLLSSDGPTAQARLIHRVVCSLSGKTEVFREAELELMGAKELELLSALIEATLQGVCTPDDLAKARVSVTSYSGWGDS
jgi:hypothetical protein